MTAATMIWVAAVTLHERGQVEFHAAEVADEVRRLFPGASYPNVRQYIRTSTNVTGSQAYSFAYLIRDSLGFYRLTMPSDPNPLYKVRWPERAEMDPEHLPLWERWVEGQRVIQRTDSAAAQIEEESVDPSVHSTHSSYREAMLEHLLIGELMRHLWPKRLLEVCKPQVDSAGYDLILQCDGVLRHVQLKTSTLGASTASVNLHVELWKRQGGCVIWTRFDPETLALKEFWWLGGPLPELEGLEVAKHTKGNAEGEKAPRPSLRKVPKGYFKRLGSVAELVEHLFGN